MPRTKLNPITCRECGERRGMATSTKCWRCYARERRRATAGTRPPPGGRREGAGRPRTMDAAIRQSVYLDQSDYHMISNWQDQFGGSFSAALRGILAAFRARQS